MGRSPSKVTHGFYPTPERVRTQRLVSFAVGDLPALTIGTLYRDGRPLTRGKSLLTRATFTLDFDRQRVLRLAEAQSGGVLSADALLLTAAWSPMALTACVTFPLSGHSHGVCVPVPEVLRWCYGSSSRMLQAVLSGELPGVLEEVVSSAHRQNGQYDLTLPAGFVEQDAPTLAWLAGDEHARERALNVDRSVMVNAGQAGRPDLSHPSAVFPYAGQHSLTALGRWVSSQGGRPRFLVHRVTSTSYRLPFRVSVPTPRYEPFSQGGEQGGFRQRRTPPADGRRSSIVSTTEPRRSGNPARLPALPSQFSDQPALRREGSVEPSPAARPLGTQTPTGTFSTGLGEDSASRARRATLAHQEPGKAAEPPIRSGDFETLRRVLALLGRHLFTVSELAVNNPVGQESRFRNWTKENGERIGCLIAQLEREGRFFYLFEKERVGREYGPLLLAWHADRREASGAELDALLDLRAAGRTWPRAHADWVLRAVPHNFTSDGSFAAGLLSHLLGRAGKPLSTA